MQNRSDIGMMLFQTQVAIHTSRAMVAENKRDQAYVQQMKEAARRVIEKSRRLLTKPEAEETRLSTPLVDSLIPSGMLPEV